MNISDSMGFVYSSQKAIYKDVFQDANIAAPVTIVAKTEDSQGAKTAASVAIAEKAADEIMDSIIEKNRPFLEGLKEKGRFLDKALVEAMMNGNMVYGGLDAAYRILHNNNQAGATENDFVIWYEKRGDRLREKGFKVMFMSSMPEFRDLKTDDLFKDQIDRIRKIFESQTKASANVVPKAPSLTISMQQVIDITNNFKIFNDTVLAANSKEAAALLQGNPKLNLAIWSEAGEPKKYFLLSQEMLKKEEAAKELHSIEPYFLSRDPSLEKYFRVKHPDSINILNDFFRQNPTRTHVIHPRISNYGYCSVFDPNFTYEISFPGKAGLTNPITFSFSIPKSLTQPLQFEFQNPWTPNKEATKVVFNDKNSMIAHAKTLVHAQQWVIVERRLTIAKEINSQIRNSNTDKETAKKMLESDSKLRFLIRQIPGKAVTFELSYKDKEGKIYHHILEFNMEGKLKFQSSAYDHTYNSFEALLTHLQLK